VTDIFQVTVSITGGYLPLLPLQMGQAMQELAKETWYASILIITWKC